MADEQQSGNIELAADAMYREESFTDLRVGSIRKFTPVTADGDDDPDRDVFYQGQASLMTPGGALPLNFELEAESLSAAIKIFPEAAEKAAEEMINELREMQREQANRIQVPGAQDFGGGGGYGGGQSGGGRIQL
ncbi:MAG: hypothetical protein CMN28_06970 [Salinisphaeraceae bacterium]|jgi:uncharacterized protein YyaL (SSP411 family)|nr:hypothetical protein [Salinisphaeraceae bacterium]